MGESQTQIPKRRPDGSSAARKRHPSKKSGRSTRSRSRTSKSSRSGSTRSRKSSRRSSKTRKSSSRSRSRRSGRSKKSQRSGKSSYYYRTRRYQLWAKLQKATEEKKKRAENRRKMAGIMQAVMVIMLFAALISVLIFTLIPWLKNGTLNDKLSFHVVQGSVEVILLLTATMMISSSGQAYSDLHTSLIIGAASWNAFMILDGMVMHFTEECEQREDKNLWCPLVQAALNHHVTIMNLTCLLCHGIAFLLSVASIIFTSRSRKDFYEINTLFSSLDQSLEADRKRDAKKTRKSRSSKSSRRSRSKKSGRSTRSSKDSRKRKNKRRGRKEERLQKV